MERQRQRLRPFPHAALTRNGGTVVKIAQGIKQRRRFYTEAAILADSLKEAG
jgi:hypothetical protein